MAVALLQSSIAIDVKDTQHKTMRETMRGQRIFHLIAEMAVLAAVKR